MTFEFSKLHGLGNDYVYLDLFRQELDADWSALAPIVSDRHFGIGGDGIILICPGDTARVRMRIFNADGSEAQMCGNGLRCTAKYAYEHGLLADDLIDLPPGLEQVVRGFSERPDQWRATKIETGAGVLTVAMHVSAERRVDRVCVDMGAPILEPTKIPVKLDGERVIRHPLDTPAGQMQVTCVSMGNPHAVIFFDDDCLDRVDIDRIGPMIEHHSLFPERTNVHFVHASSSTQVRVIPWERGSGRTLACGTGACAVCVAGVLEGRLDRTIAAELPGGRLDIFWNDRDDRVYMLGPATEVCRGRWLGQIPLRENVSSVAAKS